MKKTLISMFIIAAASLASAATYTTTTGQWGASKGNCYGWSDMLNGPGYLSTAGGTLPDEVELTSITLIHGSGAGSLDAGSKIAMFTFTTDGTVGAFVGISDNVVAAPAEGSITYTFSNIEISTTTQYRYLLVSSSATAANFSAAPGADNKAAYQAVSGYLNLEGENLGAGFPSGSGVFIDNTAGGGNNSWWGNKLDVTYKTKDLTVPEPATATLSLLALAGLAARRRRK